MHPTMFTLNQWQVMMFWYATLTTICGGILLMTIVKSGYKYMTSALNPGIRVSFIEDVQRMFIAMLLIAMVPVFITVLSGINDGFVWICGKLVNYFVDNPGTKEPVLKEAAGMFEAVIAAPFNGVIKIFNGIFNLKSIDNLIFNGATKVFGDKLFGTINTGNVLANAVINSSLVGFDIYFNAVYTIRKWVITANIVVTPIIVWVWVFTAQRQVLEIWVAEIIQTIFLQSAHALSIGIFMSIAGATGSALNISGPLDTSLFASGLIKIGVFFAGFAGSICVGVVIVMGIRLILASTEKEREEAKSGLTKAFIGLIILGLCVVIASFLATLFSGSWGVK